MIYLDDPDFTLHVGDVLEVLAELPDESVDCVVTSPPYYGLRDYGTAEWKGGDADCDHLQQTGGTGASTLGAASGGNDMSDAARERSTTRSFVPYKRTCAKCGAERVDRQIGLEPTFAEYLDGLVVVFREVRRVLSKHGVVWLNMGDSYASKTRGSDKGWEKSRLRNPGDTQKRQAASLYATGGDRHRGKRDGFKDKDLMLVPHRLAIALQDDGWWVRADVVWDKPNAMPESATDRPTKSHEYVFLLAKSLRYHYDEAAVREPLSPVTLPRIARASHLVKSALPSRIANPRVRKSATWDERKAAGASRGNREHGADTQRAVHGEGVTHDLGDPSVGRNLRSVWRIASKGYKGAHFATYPEELVERCILSGCPIEVCTTCGTPRKRLLEISYTRAAGGTSGTRRDGAEPDGNERGMVGKPTLNKVARTTGFSDCGCGAPFRHGVVLDPFIGSGTTAVVARRLGRRSIGIELNPDYAAMCAKRLDTLQLLLPEAV